MKESQKLMYQHSEIKVKLLKLYLERYLNILNQSTFINRVYLYDLFCGEGIYENDGKGSPLIFLETIKNIHFANKAKGKNSTEFYLYFNDIEKIKIDKLENIIDTRKLFYHSMGKMKFENKDYRTLIPMLSESLLHKNSNERAFIFIDPYGYKDIKISDITQLLDNGKSEILLFLPTQFMFRFENKGTPESLKKFIEEIVPEDDWPRSATGIEFIERLKNGFKKTISADAFVDSFIISRDKNQFFCLFFFTKHLYGFDRMLDAKWKIDEEQGRGWSFTSNGNPTLFDPLPNTFGLEKFIIETLKKNKLTNGELYLLTLNKGHLPSHTTAILSKLQNQGILKTIDHEGNPGRKGAFYVNYKMYIKEPDRITMSIKLK